MQLRFGEFAFDSEARRLSRGDRPVHLEPKAYELLELLLERRPAAVAKASIRDRLWPRTFVSESSLTTLVAQLRRSLGRHDRAIRTVRGFGYAFDGEATAVDAAGLASPAPSATTVVGTGPCVVFQEQIHALIEGANLLGRDPTARVIVDGPGVSRRHAQIVVSGALVAIEDLGSKNGTFVRDRRIDRRTPLADRDRLRLGRTVILYRCPRLPASTDTELP